MDSFVETVIYNIVQTRTEKNISLAALADRMGYAHPSTMYKKLSGESPIYLDDIPRFADALEVSIRELLKYADANSIEDETMEIEKCYSYENLSIDPKTCVCVTDMPVSLLRTDNQSNMTSIKQVATLFYNTCYEKYGSRQIYIIRPLNGILTLGVALKYKYLYNGKAPEKIAFLNFRRLFHVTYGDNVVMRVVPEEEADYSIKTISAFCNRISKVDVTGIFVERYPGIWSIIHDGMITENDNGVLSASMFPDLFDESLQKNI